MLGLGNSVDSPDVPSPSASVTQTQHCLWALLNMVSSLPFLQPEMKPFDMPGPFSKLTEPTRIDCYSNDRSKLSEYEQHHCYSTLSVPVCRVPELLSAHMQNCIKCSMQVGFASLYEVTELGGDIAYPRLHTL